MTPASDIVRYIFSTGGLVLLLVFGAVWLRLRGRSGGPRTLIFTTAVVFGVASIYAVDDFVSRILTAGFHPFVARDLQRRGRTAIVLLGSGSVTEADWDSRLFSVPDRTGVARVVEAARVFRLIDPAVVISSGGNVHPDDVEAPSGETMRTALIELGVPASRIVVERQSKTTHDEAVLIGPMLREMQIDSVVLVTSDTHMRRSLATFRAAGIDAVPAAARSVYALDSWADWLLPTTNGLEAASTLIHEFLGIGYYRLRGWYR